MAPLPFSFTAFAWRCNLLLAAGLGLVSCHTPTEDDAEAEAAALTQAQPQALKVSMAEWSLLEMSYEEAKAISKQSAEVGQYRVAADVIEVVRSDNEGKPTKVNASGHVFLEMTLMNRATALCHEAIITPGEATLHGKPMMMQSSRIARAKDSSTSFRITDHLRVTGSFEFIKPEELMQSLMGGNDIVIPEPQKTAQSRVTETSAQ